MKVKLRSWFLGILLIASFILLGSLTVAYAYHWFDYGYGSPCRWPNKTTKMSLNLNGGFPSGNPWTDILIRAMQDWNEVIGSDFTFTWISENVDINDHYDRKNAVTWVSHGCKDWVGITYLTRSGNNWIDTDIWFDTDCSSFLYLSLPAQEINAGLRNYLSFLYLAQHELGHALGLAHEFEIVSAMNYGRIFERLHSDDKNGLRFLYPGSGTETDLSVTNAVDDGPDGFMRHASAFSEVVGIGQTYYNLDLVIENMGTQDVGNVDLGIYLYPQGCNNTSCGYLLHRENFYYGFPVNTTESWLGFGPVMVPANTPEGDDYTVVVCIDDTERVAESDETNNCLPNPWYKVKVRTPPPPPGQPTANPPSPNNGSFRLSWPASTGGKYPLVGYEIETCLDSRVLGFCFPYKSYFTSNNYYDFSGFPKAWDYTLQVKAIDSEEGISDPSPTIDVRITEARFPFEVKEGWNLISLPGNVSNYNKNILFPTAISDAFKYNGTYVPTTQLQTGKGYWLKFPSTQTIFLQSNINDIDNLTIPLTAGWNLIGSISSPIDVTTITSDPEGIVTSDYLTYGINMFECFWYFACDPKYLPVDTLMPGYAFWVKTKGSGSITLSANLQSYNASSGANLTTHLQATQSAMSEKSSAIPDLSGLNKIILKDKKNRTQLLYYGFPFEPIPIAKTELPPKRENIFDVRFKSTGQGSYLKAFSSVPTVIPKEYVIYLSSAQYPVKLIGKLSQTNYASTISYNSNGKTYKKILKDGQTLIIRGAKADSLTLSVINEPPKLSLPFRNKTIKAGKTFTFKVAAKDPEKGFLELSAIEFPKGTKFPKLTGWNKINQTFTFTPTSAQIGKTYSITFVATDGMGASESKIVNITVKK